MERTYVRNDEIRRYEHTVIIAVEHRTDRMVEKIDMAQDELSLTLDQAPTTAEKDEIDDILAATERFPKSASGDTLVYKLQPVDESDPDLPDGHKLWKERVSQLFGDVGDLGKDEGGVPPEDVTPGNLKVETTIDIPDGASQEAIDRLDDVMVAYGRIPESEV